jgi:hypothetical protein
MGLVHWGFMGQRGAAFVVLSVQATDQSDGLGIHWGILIMEGVGGHHEPPCSARRCVCVE